MRTGLLIAALFIGAAVVAAPTPSTTTASQKARKATTPLDIGMTTEEILAAVGKPQEVKPMAKHEGKAEVWTYRRVIGHDVAQIASGTRDVPAFVGDVHNLGTMKEIIYTPVRRTKYRVTALLIYEGRLTSAKQWVETKEDFE
jgi:hypothetical protein